MCRICCSKALVAVLLAAIPVPSFGQTVLPHADPSERAGERPYEMVWAHRTEPSPPTIRFDNLEGWTCRVSGGAEAVVQPTCEQTLWGRAVTRVRYRCGAKSDLAPVITLLPPSPVPIVEGCDSVDMWVYGNRWDWENPPDTPPVRIALRIRDAGGEERALDVDRMRWKEWWLLHRRLPAGLRFPAKIESIEIIGGTQPEWRDIYADSIRFYQEPLAPLHFNPRPRRNLTLFAGQPAGANTGLGVLPFPTRDETILPRQLGGKYRNNVAKEGSAFVLAYRGSDTSIRYRFDPAAGLSGLTAQMGSGPAFRIMEGGMVRTGDGPQAGLTSAKLADGLITALYRDGTELRLAIRQKSLIADVINRTGNATEIAFGRITGIDEPRALYVPPITYGGSNPTVLLAKTGGRTLFASIWPDWYRSNASELYGAEETAAHAARINGGIRYLPRTDGRRNALFERVFVTVSPRFEEALPVIPNPVGLHAATAGDRLWQESWGPDDYQKQMKRSRMLRAYGIEKLIQCNHEIAWRDGGESFTLRIHAAPKKGGDAALQRYVAHQRSLGWLSGLYTNYTDFAPVNEHWTPDYVQRDSTGEWRSAWPRNWALKPLAAVELDALLAPQVEAKYNSNSAYTDVQTAVAPWAYNDFDARVPGAATFAQTFYAYGELLRNDSRVYHGPIFSEGTYQWLYAGLADGNYGLTYNGRNLATSPLLPAFDLREIHTRECDIGVPWTSMFCENIPNWRAPENLDRAIDRFLLTTLAYGHIGWLVEEDYGIARTCRSYYMLQQVQSRYALKPPVRVAYWDGARLRSTSEALELGLPSSRRQLLVEYPGGLTLWLNDHPSEDWRVTVGKRIVTLPPAGWAAWHPGDAGHEMLATSAMAPNGRADYLRSASYTFLDGRGKWFSTPDAATDGSLAICPAGPNRLQIVRFSGDAAFTIRRPYGVRGVAVECRAFDEEGKPLGAAKLRDGGEETVVEPLKGGIRYELRFSGRRKWSIHTTGSDAAPGAEVFVVPDGRTEVEWQADGADVRQGRVMLPYNAPPGTWVWVGARSGSETRWARIRIVEPVTWRWTTSEDDGATHIRLAPTWALAGTPQTTFRMTVSATGPWYFFPASFRIDPARPLDTITVSVASEAPAGAQGTLTIANERAPGSPPFRLDLKRIKEQPVFARLWELPFAWGIARRRGTETPEPGGSGAQCVVDSNLTVGGVTRRGLFMHPPYNGGVGYTWAEVGPVDVPKDAAVAHCWIGLRDGGDASDGVVFRLEVVDSKSARHVVAEQLGVQREWRELAGDLSPWAGQRVRLRLIADVGPQDNSSADWACWGEPVVQRTWPRVRTQVSVPKE